MVQGELSSSPSTYMVSTSARSAESKQMSFQMFKQLDEARAQASGAAAKSRNTTQNYGAWGPIYKNKEHFKNMHNC